MLSYDSVRVCVRTADLCTTDTLALEDRSFS